MLICQAEVGRSGCQMESDRSTGGKKLPNFHFFFASNEVSTCSECCCGILQLCDVCKGGSGGLNGATNHQYLRNREQKIHSPEKFQFYNF